MTLKCKCGETFSNMQGLTAMQQYKEHVQIGMPPLRLQIEERQQHREQHKLILSAKEVN